MAMGKTQDQVALRERRIDEALEESFPASDPPFFVAAGRAPGDRPPAEEPMETPAPAGKQARKKR
jgi:hypothetical protein